MHNIPKHTKISLILFPDQSQLYHIHWYWYLLQGILSEDAFVHMYDSMYSYSMMQALVELVDHMMFETILRTNRLHNRLTIDKRMIWPWWRLVIWSDTYGSLQTIDMRCHWLIWIRLHDTIQTCFECIFILEKEKDHFSQEISHSNEPFVVSSEQRQLIKSPQQIWQKPR